MKVSRRALTALALLVAIACLSTPAGAAVDDRGTGVDRSVPGPLEAQARGVYVDAMHGLADTYQFAADVAAARGEFGMACPVPGSTFVSSFGAPRTGHLHQGVDMMADHGTVIVAPEAGLFEGDGESFYLYADSGTTYFGTHNGGDLTPSGSRVTRGQPISTVSNTGNAAGGSPHLHFEIRPGGGAAVDPYPATLAACTRPAAPAPLAVAARAGDTITDTERRFCRYVTAGRIDANLIACLHAAEGHAQGSPGHRWSDYQREARRLRAYLRALAPRTCSGPADCPALIRAAFAQMGVGWQADKAVDVAVCESTLNPRATNGSHDGLFQQSRAYWAGRAATYGMAGRSAYDPWANSIVSAGMVRDTGGWSHWACG